MQAILPLIGRVLIALYFVPAGIGKLGEGFSSNVAYASSAGLPLPTLGVTVATAVEIVAGIAFLLGLQARLAALLLGVFTVLAAFFFHNYWVMPEQMQMIQHIIFWNHMALVGGLLTYMAFGAGSWSMDHVLEEHPPRQSGRPLKKD